MDTPHTTHNGPSEKASAAGRLAAQLPSDALRTLGGRVEDALRAAHDPALGLDRSVCLRDVVEFTLRHDASSSVMAYLIRREFGGEK